MHTLIYRTEKYITNQGFANNYFTVLALNYAIPDSTKSLTRNPENGYLPSSISVRGNLKVKTRWLSVAEASLFLLNFS